MSWLRRSVWLLLTATLWLIVGPQFVAVATATTPPVSVTYVYDSTANSSSPNAEHAGPPDRGQILNLGNAAGSANCPSRSVAFFVAADSLAGISTAEQGIASDARAIYSSKAFGEIRAAHAAGTSAEITVNGTTVVYEPGLSASGMTLFGENGFVIGRGAFASDSELAQTIAHESYRLATSASAGGVDAGLAKAETNAAFNFAQQVGPYVMGGP